MPQHEFSLLLIHSNTDEFATVRVVLRLSNCSEHSLKSRLPRLEVRLDAFAISPTDTGIEGSTSARDLIFSGVVDDKEEPLVVVNAFEGDEGSGNHVYVIWKIEAFLSKLLLWLALLQRVLMIRRSASCSHSIPIGSFHSLCDSQPAIKIHRCTT